MRIRPISVLIPSESAQTDINGHVVRAKTAFAQMREADAYQALETQMLVYRIKHQQRDYTGIVLGVDITEFDKNTIIHHELTIPRKVKQQTSVALEQGGFSKPILLTHRPIPIVQNIIKEVTSKAPLIEVTLKKYKAIHQIWPITDPRDVSAIHDAYLDKQNGYIVDGHHRTAAMKALYNNPDIHINEGLCAMFDIEQLDILPFHRIVDIAQPIEGVIHKLDACGRLVELDQPRAPSQIGEVIILSDRRCWSLRWTNIPADKIEKLDVNLFSERILKDILDIHQESTSSQLQYIEGKYRIDQIQSMIANTQKMAFLLHPISMNDLIDITDGGQLLPPKSTWFLPRMANGIISIQL